MEAAAEETPAETDEVGGELAAARFEVEEAASETVEEPAPAAAPDDAAEAGTEVEAAPEGEDVAEDQAAAEDQVSEGGTEPPSARTPPTSPPPCANRVHAISIGFPAACAAVAAATAIRRPARPRARRKRAPSSAPSPRLEQRRPPREGAAASISDLLRGGQEIIVQIAKEPLGQKGARITSHIALPGRFLVYMPTVDHIGVSRKIPSDEERSRLKRVLQANRTGIPGGFIVRTAGDGRSEEELRADMHSFTTCGST